MPTTTDLLSIIEQEETPNINQLAKKLGIPIKQLEKILKDLSEHNLVEYNQQTGKVKPSPWLININQEIENIKPSTGTIILPKNQQIKLQDTTIENFTNTDLELNIRLTTKNKEIAICKIS
ncbi:MAG: hypothetical protein OEY95_05700 [Candidatus Bathyarchaeota archaeon]|nr:hypothetical protein [Candidatus Bathyarchaeota archaeon]